MAPSEGDRRLRRVYGPRADPPAPPQELKKPVPRRRGWLVAIGATTVLLAVMAGAGYAVTPHEHVAPGCLWWSATTVDGIRPGDSGCARGYFLAGALSESVDPAAYRVSVEIPADRTCKFRPGDPIVVRYHAVFDDGRTIIVVDACT